MSEVNKETAQNPAAKGNASQKEEPKQIPLEVFAKGELELAIPISSQDKQITKLKYDFMALSGWEYVEAMDTDQKVRNVFMISKKQALCLFAAAAAKATEGLDAIDIRQRIGLVDAQRAAQVATLFLNRADREPGKNTYGV